MKQCIICNGETRVLYDQQFDVDFYQCKECEFIARDREAIVDLKEEKDVYDLHENSFENEGYVNMFRQFLDQSMVPFVGDGKRSLDFGSGPEPVLSQLLTKEYGYQVDIYDKFYSSEKSYVGKKYDLVTSTEVVEHLDDPVRYFKLFASLLKEDGVLAIMTLFHHDDDEHFLNWFYRRDCTHISFFRERTLREIADQAGLILIHHDHKRCVTFKLKSYVK